MPATVRRAARALREADVSLWPEGSAGRGKAAEVNPHHLVNLAIAIAVADPITSAPDAVRKYRQFEPCYSRTYAVDLSMLTGEPLPPTTSRGINDDSDDLDRRANWFDGPTFGDAMERFIHMLADPIHPETPEALEMCGIYVGLSVSALPSARVYGVTERNTTAACDYYFPKGVNRLLPPASSGMIIREAVLPFRLFKALAELWADTLAQGKTDTTLSLDTAPASVVSKNENAGSPAREPARTPIQDHNSIPGGNTPEPKRESENSQAQSSCGPGPPTHFMRTNPHEHSDSHPAFALVA